MTDTHSDLYYSLQAALRHPNCASSTWLDNPSINKAQIHVDDSNVNSRYWMDDDMEPISITFPAKLNLNGIHSQLTLDLTEEYNKFVIRKSFIFRLSLLSQFHRNQMTMTSNPSGQSSNYPR